MWVQSTGVVTKLAGSVAGASGALDGSGLNALFHSPGSLVLDSPTSSSFAKYVYIADELNHKVRVYVACCPGGDCLATGTLGCYGVGTIAGGGVTGSTHGDIDASGSSALFYGPAGLSLDSVSHAAHAPSLRSALRSSTRTPPPHTRYPSRTPAARQPLRD